MWNDKHHCDERDRDRDHDHEHEHEHEHENKGNRCNGCICNQLRRLEAGTEVDVFLLGGQVLEDIVFMKFNRNNCCAFFNDVTTEKGSTLIVDCRDITALRLEAD
ncbi:DUF3915 domain-containing protein [bacterium LRH843]|nr:DUF3915 domain-containing protein [bacterium LRH843]